MFAIKVASWFKLPETQKTTTLFDSCSTFASEEY